ncbi:hypothetical protein BFP72_09720 [Reichenbachiella sp. 5M10]|uniref:YceI family protein n=1 Tax=Reichenbachiella sp. 5M10 TaxID=1889772 RepID=UPI000C158757|nr:YceI family protein [Reichenbachiella sp. 5M10]PIB35648.1 hypothetical protein BFP72_09720 [Reichenbachiella sp. 5M10]
MDQLLRFSFFAFLMCMLLGMTPMLYGQNKSHTVKIKSSTISVLGKTNVNEFECTLHKEGLREGMRVESQWSSYQLRFEGLLLRYRISDFDCGMEVMNADFRELLQAEEYPFLQLQIHNLLLAQNTTEIARLNVSADVSIELAGVIRDYRVYHGTVINQSAHDLVFRGSQLMKMSDFGIEPPTKFLGTIKVADEIVVEFEIHMNAIPIP